MLHRLDPRAKLAVLAAAMAAVFWLSHASLLVLGLALLLVGGLGGLRPAYLLRGLRPILWILALSVAFNATFVPGPRIHEGLPFTWPGLERGGLLVLRVSCLVLLTSLLTLTTSPVRLCDAVEGLLRPLKVVGLKPHEVALVFTVALRFVPTLALEAERIMRAQTARGACFDRGNPWRRLRSLVSLLVPLFTRAFHHADRLAIAMEARGYIGGRGRTRLRPLRFGAADLGFLAASVACLAALVWLDRPL
ncbi:MAG: energy-coupling factor transporter transmembrane component T [Candidatus Eremiobacterota bacterium]